MLETTILVSFNGGSSSADHSILVELDDVLNVDSNGDVITSFGQEDTPHIRFAASTNVTLDAVVATAGGIIDLGTFPRSLNTEQLFASRDKDDKDTYTIPVVETSYSVSYVGNTGGYTVTTEPYGVKTLTGSTELAPFLADIVANYRARIFRLIPPDMNLVNDDDTFQIYVVFYVTVAEDK